MRGDDLPASVALDVSVRIALLFFRHRLPVALIFCYDEAGENHGIAVYTSPSLFSVKLHRRPLTTARTLERRNYLRLGLHRAVRKSDDEVVGHDCRHRFLVMLLVGIEPRSFQFLHCLGCIILRSRVATARNQHQNDKTKPGKFHSSSEETVSNST